MIKLGGKEYHFQVGTFLHEKHVEDLTGASITELYESMKKAPAKGYISLIYGGILAGYQMEKIECPLSKEDLEILLNGEQLDELIKQVMPEDKKKVSTPSS